MADILNSEGITSQEQIHEAQYNMVGYSVGARDEWWKEPAPLTSWQADMCQYVDWHYTANLDDSASPEQKEGARQCIRELAHRYGLA